MSTRLQNRSQLARNMRSKAYRDAFVETHIRNGIAFQIRAIRGMRRMTQAQLAEKTGTQQEAISRLENPDYGRPTLETLRKLASVFDVGLVVSFVPFSKLADRASFLTPQDVEVVSFDDDAGFSNYSDTVNVHSIMEPSLASGNLRVSASTAKSG